jgi:adenylate cyclase
LIRLKLKRISERSSEVAAPDIQAIVKGTDGNPFYIEELVNYLHDLAIDLRDEHALDRVDLPTGLHSLILSRIDQLTENRKITIKIASMVGRLFKAAILWGAYPLIGSPEIVKKNLEALAHFELTIQDNEPEPTYFFKHIVTQEVAYESLPFAMRALLHNLIGEHLEQIYSDSLGQFYDLLAFLFSHSDNQPKKREYLRKASESVQSHYNNEAVVDYYLRLLPLLERDEKGPVLLRLGEVLVVLGRWYEAREQFQQALSPAEERGDRRALA